MEPQGNIIYCTNCGQAISPGAAFCASCGGEAASRTARSIPGPAPVPQGGVVVPLPAGSPSPVGADGGKPAGYGLLTAAGVMLLLSPLNGILAAAFNWDFSAGNMFGLAGQPLLSPMPVYLWPFMNGLDVTAVPWIFRIIDILIAIWAGVTVLTRARREVSGRKTLLIGRVYLAGIVLWWMDPIFVELVFRHNYSFFQNRVGQFTGMYGSYYNIVFGVLSTLVVVFLLVGTRRNRRPPRAGQVRPATIGYPVAGPAVARPGDARSFGYALLGFFVPIAGLVCYLVWKDTLPLRARSAGKGALINVIVQACVYIILFAIYATVLSQL